MVTIQLQFLLILTVFETLSQNVSPIKTKFHFTCTTPNNDSGICIPIVQCAIIMNEIRINQTKAYKFVTESSCGRFVKNINEQTVCCGQFGNFIETSSQAEDSVEASTAQPTSTTAAPYVNTGLPRRCGKQSVIMVNRIFGGNKSELGEFPWLTRLIHRDANGRKNFGCAGFVISRRYVLTAAHCIASEYTSKIGPVFEVMVGEHHTEASIDCVRQGAKIICADPVQILESGTVIVHPNYDNTSVNHHHDIALIPLKQTVNFTDFVQPICLPDKPSETTELWVSGWGSTETSYASKIKLKASLPRVAQSVCTNKFWEVGLEVLDSQMCAGGTNGKDSCRGDSGGPLMVENNNGVWFAEGIVSYGHWSGCGVTGWPGVYTSVPWYKGWILETIQQHRAKSRERVFTKHGIVFPRN